MKKALIAMIIILSALIAAIVMFVVGVSLTRNSNDGADGQENTDTTALTQNDKAESDGEDDSRATDEQAEPVTEAEETDTESAEEDPKPEPQPEKTQEQEKEEEKSEPAAYADYSADDNKWYRVRTSAESDGRQDGAFKSFANAKAHADTLKAEGFKVYDNNMKCIYVP